jgi:hypothetical protein
LKQRSLITALSFLIASAASATVFQPSTDRQLVDRSAAVVVATVRDAASHMRSDGYIVTDYRFDVEQTLKGTVDRTITVSEFGGAVGDRFTFIADSASYAPGERVIAFLKSRGDGTYFTTSMAMGKFSFTRDASGEAVVIRTVDELPNDPARNADAFERFVQGSSQGTATTESYVRKLTPIVNSLRPRVLSFPASAYCLTFGNPLRWQGGEGGTISFYVTGGTLAGVPNSATNIANGMAAWTNDPGAGITLSGGGTPPMATTAPQVDLQNVIYLNQNPPPSATFCDQIDVCTILSGDTSTTHVFHGETFISIQDTDIVVGSSVPAQFEALITHELGHAIGFRHANDSGSSPSSSVALMSSPVNQAFGSALQQWDKDAVDTVYGNGPVCQPPTSVSISGGGTYPSGQTATLIATVTGGNSTLTYAWFDGPLNSTTTPVGTNSSTFTTPPITVAKDYWVRVTGACGLAVSAATSVAPQPVGPGCTPVFIATQPGSQTISSGGTATFNAAAGGTTPFTFQWFQATSITDTSHPVGTNSPSFTTPALTQTTSYFLRITNACGTAFTNVVNASVNVGGCTKPAFSTQPAGTTIVSGAQTFLFALASNAASYQWFKGPAGDTSTPLTGLGPSNDRWINQLFVDLLGRTPSSSEVSVYSALLTGGASRLDVAGSFLVSNEYRTKLLTDYYATFLHRPISAAEVSFWLPAFASSMTDEQIEAQIIASPEYFALAGATNTGWINRVFNDVLGRSPSASETSTFLALLGSSSRMSVGQAVLTSSESDNKRVQQYFTRILRRSPSSLDLSTSVASLLGGATNEEILAQILAADEYFNFGTVLITSPLTATTSFWVRATNQCGNTDSAVAIVTVPQCAAPVIVTQPQNVSLTVGDTFSVAVLATNAVSYQWYRASSGDPSNPVTGATGPVFTGSNTNVGPTDYWVKVTNSCGSTNSNTVTLTTICGPRVLTMSVPPVAFSGSQYTVSWNGDPNHDVQYLLQEATASNFTNAQTFQLTTASKTFTHTAAADTRYYYRVSAAPVCGGNFGTNSATTSVLVTAPQPPTNSSYNFAQLPCTSCNITQNIFVPAVQKVGKDALATGDTFSVTSDKPFMTVTPSSGQLPPEGATVTVTIDTSQMDVGSTQGTVIINRASGAGKTGILGDPPAPINVPVSVSVVAPVTPKGKDPNGGFNALLIPAVAHADGIGTRFVSDLRITNTAAQSINYQVTFTPSNTDGTQTGKQISFSVNPGDTKALNDVVKDWFGSGVQGEPGIGSLEIRPTNYAGKDPVNITLATVAASRTYSVQAAGTFGQFIPALPLVNFLAKSDVSKISLQQVSQSNTNSGFRTNLGFVEGSGQPVNFVASLFSDAGSKITERAYSLQPYESQQIKLDSFFNVNGVTVPNIADARVEVRVTSDSGHVSAYASVLDNTTTDPLLVFPADPSKISAKRFVVPGVAEFDSSFSNFHTDMRIYNGGAAPVDVTLAFTGGTVANQVRTVAAGETLAIDNVLPTLFNTTGGGSVVATTVNDSQLILTARTYSRDKTNGGTFGQFIPAVTSADAVGNGDRALQVVQLEESPSFRTNLGLVEVTGNPVTVELQAFTPDSKVATKVSVPLGSGQYLQQNGILKSLGFSNVYNGRITAKVISGTGKVAAFGSVVDNRTADPTYVPSQ